MFLPFVVFVFQSLCLLLSFLWCTKSSKWRHLKYLIRVSFYRHCLHQGWQSHICYKIQIVLMLLIWRLEEPRRLSSATGCWFQRWYFWLKEKTWMILRYLSLVPVFLYTVRLTTWNNATSPREVSVPCQYSSRDGTSFFRHQTKCGSWIFPVLRQGGLISNVWIREDKQIQERGDLPLQLWVSVRGTMCHPDVCFKFTKIFTWMAQKQAKLISYQAWINTLPIVHSFHMRGLAVSASGGKENVKCVTIDISQLEILKYF